MIDYLFFKMYKIHKKGSLNDISGWAAMVTAGLFVWLNLFTIAAFCRKTGLLPFSLSQSYVIASMLILYGFFTYAYFYKQRYKKVIAKFEQESERNRKAGNIKVVLYILITLILFVAGAFYKPGRL